MTTPERTTPAHLITPMTTTEWRLVQLLLAQGDERANWPSRATRPTGKRITTDATRTAVDYLAKGGDIAPTDPVLGEMVSHLAAARRTIAGCIVEDLDSAAYALFTPDEWDVMDLARHTWNGDPEEHEPGYPCLQGSAWCWYYHEKLITLFTSAVLQEGRS